MKLLTKQIENKLKRNHELMSSVFLDEGKFSDIKPVVKFFNPMGSATWLITELFDDNDTLYGLCDLGFGTPELGTVSLSELQTIKNQMGLGIERDLYCNFDKTLTEYAIEATEKGYIAV